jgi:hypothetical protein
MFGSFQLHPRPFTLLALFTLLAVSSERSLEGRNEGSLEGSFEGALPISAPSLFLLFATKRKKLTPLFSYSSTLFKKECLPRPFAINLFRTLLQNTRGCTLRSSLLPP